MNDGIVSYSSCFTSRSFLGRPRLLFSGGCFFEGSAFRFPATFKAAFLVDLRSFGGVVGVWARGGGGGVLFATACLSATLLRL